MPEKRKCKITGQEFEILDKEIAFCKNMGVPLPELSPEERMRELMASRNEWKLYRRKCDATGEEIISAYHPDSPFKVYKNEVWWGDSWEALDYGRDFDFSRPFFEQFAELQKVVPREGTSIFNCENCDFNSHIRESKNCYLNSLVARCEDTHYSYWVVNDKDVMDSVCTNNSTLCYECLDCDNCYSCVVLQNSKDCHECHFSFSLKNCKNCLFSSNLVGKEYWVFNKFVGKEKFEKEKSKYLNGSWKSYREAFDKYIDLKKNSIQRFVNNNNCENVTGDQLYNSRNCNNVFEGNDNEDAFNAISLAESKDVYNSYSAGWPGCEVVYYCCVSRGSQNIAFCTYTWFSSDLHYCDSMNASHNCFGCIGLRQKKNCILNKQYTKAEYEALMPKIIEHMMKTNEWGKFFPPYLSPFAYNESPAQDYYPLKKEVAVKMGFKWLDYEAPIPIVEKVIKASQLPDNIKGIPDDILNWAIECESTKKPFKIVPQELKFYRSMNLPIPHRHPEKRHADRMALRNPHKLWNRNCANCGTAIRTTYSPDRPETVYCEQCYLKEVY